MNGPSPLHDRANSFGWISIALHWLIAIIVTALWLLGKSIEFQAPEDILQQRKLHVTLGLIAWLFIAARIGWRTHCGHPRAHGLTDATHRLAKAAHFVMLGMLAVMLFTGPLLAWADSLFPSLVDALHFVHGTTANLLGLMIVIHIAAALKHFMFHDDETMARIFVPKP